MAISSSKAPAKTAATKRHAHPSPASHPAWVDMIKECITAHSEAARSGVSRPIIKKFVQDNYQVEMNAAAASQLNRAISHGAEKGTFSLPKGPSGKVKLASKIRTDSAKENNSLTHKKPTSTKSATTKPSKKSTTTTTRLASAKTKPESAVTPRKPTTKKYKSAAKSGRRAKKAAATKRTSPTKKAKKAVTGPTKSRSKPTKRKPSSKAASAK